MLWRIIELLLNLYKDCRGEETMDIFYFSSSHWDREWYQDFQGFRYRLVKMVDKLLGVFKNDPDFGTLHFDGQTIVLEDYDEIRPEMKETLNLY